VTEPYELVASCPKCKTFETLYFNGQKLTPTSRFKQRGSKVYHNCGSDWDEGLPVVSSVPCRLFPSFVKKGRGLVLN
jgi:hypothetical protein